MNHMGVNIIVSPYAIIEVRPKQSRTGDMRQMIDDLELTGCPPQKRHEPAAFNVRGDMVIHPDIERQLQDKMRREINRNMDEIAFGISRFTGGGSIRTKDT